MVADAPRCTCTGTFTRIRRPEPGYGPHDAFYAAVGTYSPFQTCNEWLAAGLRQAGIRTGWWAPFAFGVTAHL